MRLIILVLGMFAIEIAEGAHNIRVVSEDIYPFIAFLLLYAAALDMIHLTNRGAKAK